jgi:hypothetical protein
MKQDGSARGFRRNGYAVLRRGISVELAHVFANYAIMQALNPDYYIADVEMRPFFPESRSRYADALGESLMLHVQPKIEKAIGEPLLPTFSYLRIYEHGSVLGKHVDRRESEIAATLTLGADASAPWPLHLQALDGAHALELAPGDIAVYEGMKVPHWREVFQGQVWIQVIFNYVRANGEFASSRFDGRPQIGPIGRRRLAG